MEEFATAGPDSSAEMDEGSVARHRCRCCGKRIHWDKNHAATLRSYIPAWQKPLLIGKCGLGIQEFSRRTSSCVSFEPLSRKSAMRRNGYAAIRVYANTVDHARRVIELAHQFVRNREAACVQDRNPLYRRAYRGEFELSTLCQREARVWRLSHGTLTPMSFGIALESYSSEQATTSTTASATTQPTTSMQLSRCQSATDFLCRGVTIAEDLLSYY